MEKMVFRAFNKPQCETELNENSTNIAGLVPPPPPPTKGSAVAEKRKSSFSAFNLFKFKRRISEQPIGEQSSQPSSGKLAMRATVSGASLRANLSSRSLSRFTLPRTHSNLSTSSIRSSKFSSLNRKDLANRHMIHKKVLRAHRLRRISPVQGKDLVQGDNRIVDRILDQTNISKTNQYEPFNEQQYLKYLFPDGRIRSLREMRLAIYRRGVESSLRSTIWKHLLNVYPPNMTSEQRVRFCQQKADRYYQLCIIWQRNFAHARVQHIHNQVSDRDLEFE